MADQEKDAPLQSRDLLRLAMELPTAALDKMAHALGWPDSRNYKATRGRVRWRNPYRNHYCGSQLDPEWRGVLTLGLAEMNESSILQSSECYWRVTDLGKKVVRLRLSALKEL